MKSASEYFGVPRSGLILAFSFVELLGAIAIVLILVAVLAPAVVSAKLSGWDTDTIERLRQFGEAQSIYTQDNGTMAFGVPDLVSAGLVPTEMAGLAFDPYKNGFVNFELGAGGSDTLNAHFMVPYKLSFYGWREWGGGGQQYADCIAGQPGAGWLLAVDTWGKATEPCLTSLNCKSKYFRLANDGSVHVRQSIAYGQCDPLVAGKCSFRPISEFADGDSAWQASLYDPGTECGN